MQFPLPVVLIGTLSWDEKQHMVDSVLLILGGNSPLSALMTLHSEPVYGVIVSNAALFKI